MNVSNIQGSKKGVRISPFLDAQDSSNSNAAVGACVEVFPSGSESEHDAILAALNKASRKFGMAPPISSWLLDSAGLLGLIFPRGMMSGGDEANLGEFAVQMAKKSAPGSHWFLAQLLTRISDPEMFVSAINACKFPPRETLVLLSSCGGLVSTSRRGYGSNHYYGRREVGEDATVKQLKDLREVRLRKPTHFDDMDMLVALRGLPAVVTAGFSDATYEALALWDFGGTAEYIVESAPPHVTSLPVLRTFGILSGIHADAGDGVRAVQGLLSPLTANFADMKFTSGFSKSVISMARMLGVNCLTETGTPLNNPFFVSWIRNNTSAVKTEEPSYHAGQDVRYTPDGMVLKIMVDLMKKDPDALAIAEGKMSGRRKDHEIIVCSKALAALMGSAALNPVERGFLLQLMFTKDAMLEKFGEVSGEIKQAHRIVEVATVSPIAYTRAPARAANLAVWLASNGIALRFTDTLEELRRTVPKLVKMRLSESREHRKRGYGAWLSWLTDPGKGKKEIECESAET